MTDGEGCWGGGGEGEHYTWSPGHKMIEAEGGGGVGGEGKETEDYTRSLGYKMTEGERVLG